MTDTEPAASDIDTERAKDLLGVMIRIRRFEAKAAEMYSAGKIRGFLHLYDGEEAVAAGAMRVLRPTDALLSTYREHGHALARGISARSVMAELYGKVEGCSGGRGGSMHLFDKDTRFYGGNAIVAAGLPVAAGLGLASKMKGRDDVTVCFFGEGAVAEGEFHESLNLAAVWKLPVLFICENNGYAMGTALHRSESETDIHKKAESYNLRSEAVDGMDPIAVEDAVRRLVDHSRAGHGPTFLEARTYRFRAHSMFDSQKYREKSEVEEEKRTRDPIMLFTQRVQELGLLDDNTVRQLEQEADAEADDAATFAEAGTLEPVEHLLVDVMTGREEATS